MSNDEPPDEQMLRKILDQVTATNGRVTALEDHAHDVDMILHGDPQMHTDGLIKDAMDASEMVRQWRTVARVGRWVAVTFGTAAVSLLANLAVGALPS